MENGRMWKAYFKFVIPAHKLLDYTDAGTYIYYFLFKKYKNKWKSIETNSIGTLLKTLKQKSEISTNCDGKKGCCMFAIFQSPVEFKV